MRRVTCSSNFMVCYCSTCIDRDAALHKKIIHTGKRFCAGAALTSEPGGGGKPRESRSACAHRHWRSVLFLSESIFKAGPRAVISI